MIAQYDDAEPGHAIRESAAMMRSLLDGGALELPMFGKGSSAERLITLMTLARTHTVSVARLAEAHVDAMGIMSEAGAQPRPGSVYGVWASSSPHGDPVLHDGLLTGTKRFCSGLGIVDRALITVNDRTLDRSVLVDVDMEMKTDTIVHDVEGWATNALRATATGDVTFRRHRVGHDEFVAPTEWYLRRPGFWHGACAPAACWAGAAIGLVDIAHGYDDRDPHRLAHVGAMLAARWSMQAMLFFAGSEIDAEPDDADLAQFRARSLRHSVERAGAEIADRFSRSFGPRPFTSDHETAQRFADLHLYLRQHHAERELGAIVDCAAIEGLTR